MPHGPQAGIAGQATRLAARAVLLAAVVAAVAASRGRARGVGRLCRQRGGLARVARRSEEGAPGDARRERRRRDRELAWTSRSPTAGGSWRCATSRAGSRASRGSRSGSRTAPRPSRARSTPRAAGPSTSIRSASTSPRTGRTSSTATRTRAAAARSRSRAACTSGRRPTACSTRSTPAARRTPRCSARASSRSRTPRRRRIVNVQDADGGNPYTNAFTPWLDTSALGLDLEGVDIAANGRLAALGFEAWNGGTQTVGKIAVLAIQGVDQAPAFPAAVDCFLPAAGIARDASLAPDAGAIAWKDDGGVKVAGTPSTTADPCVMGSAPVVLSPTGTHPSIGGADVAAFLPKPTTPRRRPERAPGNGSAPGRDAPGEGHRQGAGRLQRGQGQGRRERPREGLDHGHRSGSAGRTPRQARRRGDRRSGPRRPPAR